MALGAALDMFTPIDIAGELQVSVEPVRFRCNIMGLDLPVAA